MTSHLKDHQENRDSQSDKDGICLSYLSLPLQDILNKLQRLENEQKFSKILEKLDLTSVPYRELGQLVNTGDDKLILVSIAGWRQVLYRDDSSVQEFIDQGCVEIFTELFRKTQNFRRKRKILETLIAAIDEDSCDALEQNGFLQICSECIKSSHEELVNLSAQAIGLMAEQDEEILEQIYEMGLLDDIFSLLQSAMPDSKGQEIISSAAEHCIYYFKELDQREYLKYLQIAVHSLQKSRRESCLTNLMTIIFRFLINYEYPGSVNSELSLTNSLLQKFPYMSLENCFSGMSCIAILSQDAKTHDSICCQDFYDICSRIFKDSGENISTLKITLFIFKHLSISEESSTKLSCSNTFAGPFSKFVVKDVREFWKNENNGAGSFITALMKHKNQQILEAIYKTGIMEKLCELASYQSATLSHNKILELILLALETHRDHEEEIGESNKMCKLLYNCAPEGVPLITKISEMAQAEFCQNPKRSLLKKILTIINSIDS
ncbi:unnamed protein product [Moneuplotes crassus]|uniref:Uncharacterized protein n=1 Tax=Euplotes crassus TaxID=5936 RepID=A0AAD1UD94_EUPCR|nr:unnamed protein product [Moneuplotes crassus]